MNLLEQAQISEGISREAKKIIAEDISSNIGLITSIIAEGQEQGQIIHEDPQKLAVAYYSMVRGMTGLQSKMRDFSDLPASFADAEIIIRKDKIAWVGSSGDPEIPPAGPAARHIDGRGKTLLLGLIDAHIHTLGDANPFWHTSMPNQQRNMDSYLCSENNHQRIHVGAG